MVGIRDLRNFCVQLLLITRTAAGTTIPLPWGVPARVLRLTPETTPKKNTEPHGYQVKIPEDVGYASLTMRPRAQTPVDAIGVSQVYLCTLRPLTPNRT